MLKKIKETGVLTQEVLEQIPGYRLDALKEAKGPMVIIECAERIPCNPCQTVCPNDAIVVGDNITNLPTVIPEKCTGCGMCVAVCPGLAIFVVDLNFAPQKAAITFAYEYLPVPQKGETVVAVDREGKPVCNATVEKVVSVKKYDMTKVLTISVPLEFANNARGIQRQKGE
jgi:Fe-S-cluster-containing hydrogenase component 2